MTEKPQPSLKAKAYAALFLVAVGTALYYASRPDYYTREARRIEREVMANASRASSAVGMSDERVLAHQRCQTSERERFIAREGTSFGAASAAFNICNQRFNVR